MRTIRPVLLPMLLTEVAGYAVFALVASFLLTISRLGGLVTTILFIAAIPTIFLAASSFWVRLTEEYEVDAEGVRIKRGFFEIDAHHIAPTNIADVQVMSPVVLRSFNVGHVRIFTSDGNFRTMRNVKAPKEVAKMVSLR